ncbi:hypothetical protein [Bacillus cereus]|uniref:Uncharacterized protein n=1 Tax=Bacillus cereus TaxID=1396 RepID=A0A2B9DKC2_BACCE|nr:hypothetical protein [Bacillus cereus]PGM87987.1 hypothetical protein CN958_27785 [Bacillus cereus]
MDTNIADKLCISNEPAMLHGEFGTTWNFGNKVIKGRSGDVLLKLNNCRAVLIPGTGCINNVTISFDVENTGWKPIYEFPLMLQLKTAEDYKLSKFPLWQSDLKIDLKCNLNYPHVFHEEIKVNIYEYAELARFTYPSGITFYPCSK